MRHSPRSVCCGRSRRIQAILRASAEEEARKGAQGDEAARELRRVRRLKVLIRGY